VKTGLRVHDLGFGVLDVINGTIQLVMRFGFAAVLRATASQGPQDAHLLFFMKRQRKVV
jgi:hypothetical protein